MKRVVLLLLILTALVVGTQLASAAHSSFGTPQSGYPTFQSDTSSMRFCKQVSYTYQYCYYVLEDSSETSGGITGRLVATIITTTTTTIPAPTYEYVCETRTGSYTSCTNKIAQLTIKQVTNQNFDVRTFSCNGCDLTEWFSLSHKWEFGDGSTSFVNVPFSSTNKEVTHTFPYSFLEGCAEPVTYTVTLRFYSDTQGTTEVGSVTLDVVVVRPEPDNLSPLADIGDDHTVFRYNTVSFPSNGTDIDGNVTKLEWDWTNDTTYDFSKSYTIGITDELKNQYSFQWSICQQSKYWSDFPPAQSAEQCLMIWLSGSYGVNFAESSVLYTASKLVSSIYPDLGIYTATFRVTDQCGATTLDTASITVVNAPPVADVGMDRIERVNTIVRLAGDSEDPDGPVFTEQLTYDWDFGDGTTNSAEESPFHIYTATGEFNSALTVTDIDGATNTSFAIISVRNFGAIVGKVSSEETGVGLPGANVELCEVSKFDLTNINGFFEIEELPEGEYCLFVNATGFFDTTITVNVVGGRTSSLAFFLKPDPPESAAIIGIDLYVSEKEIPSVRFYGGGSLSGSGDISDFIWNFDDDTGSNDISVFHNYTRPPREVIKELRFVDLTVSTTTGVVARDRVPITINYVYPKQA